MSTTRIIHADEIEGLVTRRNYIGHSGGDGLLTGWATYLDSDSVTFTDAGDLVTLNSHGRENGQIVSFTVITTTTGISVNTAYYVVGATTNTFQVASTSGGSALALTTDGSGTVVFDRPVNGTGGSASSTFAVSANSALFSSSNLLWTKSANNRMGEGFSYAFSIDSALKAKPCTISAYYTVASGTYASTSTTADMTVWVFDVTNSRLIQPSSYLIQNTTGVETIKCEFQASSDSTSYRLIVHTASVSATAYTLRFDAFSVTPNTYNVGASVTDWVAWTPTGSWVSNTTYTGFKRRVGGDMEYRVKAATSGAPTSASLTITLTETIDTARLLETTDAFGDLGGGSVNDSASAAYKAFVSYKSTTAVGVRYQSNASGASSPVTQAAPITFGASDSVEVTFRVPIVGLSTSQVLSSDTDTRVVAAVYSTSVSANASTVNPVQWSTKVIDTHNCVTVGSSWKYTAAVPGVYCISPSFYLSSAATASVSLYKNGVFYGYIGSGVSNTLASGGSLLIQLVAGDYIQVRLANSQTVAADAGNNVSINMLSGPAQIAASEKVWADYSGATSTVITADVTNIDFPTKVTDSHSAWSGTVFTSPKPSWYDVSLSTYFTTSTARNIHIWVNGSKRKNITAGGAVSNSIQPGSGGVYLNAGDTMTFRSDGNGTLGAAALLHWVSITSQG